MGLCVHTQKTLLWEGAGLFSSMAAAACSSGVRHLGLLCKGKAAKALVFLDLLDPELCQEGNGPPPCIFHCVLLYCMSTYCFQVEMKMITNRQLPNISLHARKDSGRCLKTHFPTSRASPSTQELLWGRLEFDLQPEGKVRMAHSVGTVWPSQHRREVFNLTFKVASCLVLRFNLLPRLYPTWLVGFHVPRGRGSDNEERIQIKNVLSLASGVFPPWAPYIVLL